MCMRRQNKKLKIVVFEFGWKPGMDEGLKIRTKNFQVWA